MAAFNIRIYIFHMKLQILDNFYRSLIESIVTGSITVWFGSMTYDRNSLYRSISIDCQLTGVDFPYIYINFLSILWNAF